MGPFAEGWFDKPVLSTAEGLSMNWVGNADFWKEVLGQAASSYALGLQVGQV